MAQEKDNGAVAALGALLGYIGAEAATVEPFQQLLWPQRHLSKLSWSSVPALALFMPMGGPFHKVALETYDIMHAHGLFLGRRRGQMLGTAFYTALGWKYHVHSPGSPSLEARDKSTRNCLWINALGLLRVPQLDSGSKGGPEWHRAEKGVRKTAVRAQISVNHLTFSKATMEDKQSRLPFVGEGTKTPTLSVFLAIVAAESSAVVLAVALAAVWQTPWAALWVAPLVLRLLSAVTALDREPLSAVDDSSLEGTIRDYEVVHSKSDGDFIVFTGPSDIVLQFMRHYGHPVRNRWREVLQLAIVMALGSNFPLGLIVSALFMPPHLQLVWFSYQVYLVLALHFARYSPYVQKLSTHAAIAEAFSKERSDTSKGQSMLFGHTRFGPETIRVDLVATYHGRQQDGKKALEMLLNRETAGFVPAESKTDTGFSDSQG